jgi:sulfatase-like protein
MTGRRRTVAAFLNGIGPGLLLMAIYIRMAHWIAAPWSYEGLLGWDVREIFTEGPLLVVALYLLTRPLRRGFGSSLAATSVVLMVYVVHDVHYGLLYTVPDFRDVVLLPDVALVIGWPRTAALLVVAALPLVWWLACWDRGVLSRPWARTPRSLILPAAGVAALVGMFVWAPGTYVRLARGVAPGEARWAKKVEVESYGRLWSALARDAERRSIAAVVGRFASLADSGLEWNEQMAEALTPRNVYVVLLESFIDPTRFSSVRYDRSPWVDDFERQTAEHLGVSLSPLAVGGTAASEFEVLCGVPSFALFAAVDFYALSGEPAPCVPNQLREHGYRTRLLSVASPIFYNSRRAYQSIGFDELVYPRRYSPPGVESISEGADTATYIYDRYLYEHVLSIAGPVPPGGRPTFTYLLTIYGHWPFVRNRSVRPDVVAPNVPDPLMRSVANIAYYRSLALQEFFDRLEILDPDALVVVVGDHLPPLGVTAYDAAGYSGSAFPDDERGLRETPLLVRDGAAFRQFGPMRHFNIRSVIYDVLTDGRFCQEYAEQCNRRVTTPEQERSDYLDAYQVIIGFGNVDSGVRDAR